MKKLTQITFVSNNKKCVSIMPRTFLINTENFQQALHSASKLLKLSTYHHARYIALPPVVITVHDV